MGNTVQPAYKGISGAWSPPPPSRPCLIHSGTQKFASLGL